MPFRLFSRAPLMTRERPSLCASGGGDGDFPEAAEVLACQGLFGGDDVLQGAFGDDPAAVLPGARAEVDYMVGGAHYGLIVLDDEDGVANVAEALEGADEAVVVGGVKADGRLITDVEHAHQAAADLGCQSDALGLTAAEGAGGAVQGDVVEADVPKEDEPGLNLLENLLGDGELTLGEGFLDAVHGWG